MSKTSQKSGKGKKIKRGVREVVKAMKKNQKGLMIIAGNITPIDVITHIPVLCEEKEVPYIYVSAKEELGTSALTKRSTSCILVLEPAADAPYKKYYDEVKALIIEVTPNPWSE